jgi:radical SAM protein with 4Fe4S-binding SPASM domain
VVERRNQRFYLFPDYLEWFAQDSRGPRLNDLRPESFCVDYDFAKHEFDHLLVGVTNRCNIVCDYCFRGYDMRKTNELSYEDLTRVADHFLKRAQHKPTLQFTGGELFVKEHIDRLFWYLHERGFRIWMTTNGVSSKIRDNELLNRVFRDNREMHVRISLDGHTADLYERHRGRPGTFARVEENIRHLVASGVSVSTKTVLTTENFPYVEEILDWCYELGLDGWNYNVLRYTGAMADAPPENATAKRNGEQLEYVGYVEIGRKLTDILRRKPHLAPLLAVSRYGKILDTLYSPDPLGVRMQYYMLNYDGNVYTNDNLMKPEYACGNIWTDGMDAFRGLKERWDQLDLDLPCCVRCPIHRFCLQKGDFGELFEKDPSLVEEFPNCPDIREHFFEMMELGEEGVTIRNLMLGGWHSRQAIATR